MLVSHRGNGFQIDNVSCRITDRFAKDSACLVVDQSFQAARTVVLGETDFDALFGKHVSKKRIGAAVEQGDRNDVIALLGKRQDGVIDRRTAGTDASPAIPPSSSAIRFSNTSAVGFMIRV